LGLNSVNIGDERGRIRPAGVDSFALVDKVDENRWAEALTISTEPIEESAGLWARRARYPVLALVAAVVAGCGATVDQRGNLPEADRLAEIQPGTTTREQVVKILGTPSSTGVFDDKNWFYISRKTKQFAFLAPDVLDQQVYIVRFDGNGVVASVDRKDLADGRDIEPAPGATPAPGRELTFLEQIVGNLGRFNKGGGGSGEPEGRAPGPNPNPDY
jgi:outer membrane protein assembly factor BamE (lipoprotein component of BamABCDE complex)